MKSIRSYAIALLLLSVLAGHVSAQQVLKTDVLVIGGGTAGTAAGLQSARSGARTILAEETVWLGGMLSAAGVSAIDGNHHLPSGIWSEFREQLYKVYGGPARVSTGWVSNTLFEPRVGDSILKSFASSLSGLTVLYQHRFLNTLVKGNKVTGAVFLDLKTGQNITIRARQVIDATELGDVLHSAGVPADIGMEASRLTGEKVNVPESSDIIQDMTYAAILKDYGPRADCTLVRPSGYDPMEFDGCCTDFCSAPNKLTVNVDGKKMLEYGRLPNNKFMINWPGKGNDISLNMIPMNAEERRQAIEQAKAKTLRFIYFLQTQLGFRNLGLADDEFPTADRLPLIPYYRESRRMKGLVRFDLNHIATPYAQPDALYRTGIAVGDYPVDHHHRENPKAPQHLGFYPVPSFNVPLGALIPASHEGLIVAEKSISVSNVANGTTRLQPCVLLTGQAAGALAALAVQKKRQPGQVGVRAVQASLLSANAYIMPYYDVKPTHPHFLAIQKIGATGILKGEGQPYQWANRTWFYPDSLVRINELIKDLSPFADLPTPAGEKLTLGDALALAREMAARLPKSRRTVALRQLNAADGELKAAWTRWGLGDFDRARPVTRAEWAVLLDRTVDPFAAWAVDHKGNITKTHK